MKIRKIILMFIILLPNFFKLFIYKKFFKWEIGKNVHIGFSFIDSQNVLIKDNAKIGNFNEIKHLKYLELGENSNIGNLNHISGNGYKNNKWENNLSIGDKVDVTSGHVLDVGGGIYIGNNVTIAGIYTQIWSHEKNLVENQFITKPVHIGSNVYIGSSALIAPGAVIPSNTVVGLGAVVPAKLQITAGSIVVGNPAILKNKKVAILQKN